MGIARMSRLITKTSVLIRLKISKRYPHFTAGIEAFIERK